MAQVNKIADRYAEAVFSAATDAGKRDEITSQFKVISEVFNNNSDTRAILGSPLVSNQAKSKMFEKLCSHIVADELVASTLQVIAQNGRADILTALVDCLEDRLATASNKIRANVVSAVKLENKTRKSLIAAIENSTKKTVTLNETVDESIIGGLKVQIGSKLIDGSVATRLNAMKNAMRAG